MVTLFIAFSSPFKALSLRRLAHVGHSGIRPYRTEVVRPQSVQGVGGIVVMGVPKNVLPALGSPPPQRGRGTHPRLPLPARVAPPSGTPAPPPPGGPAHLRPPRPPGTGKDAPRAVMPAAPIRPGGLVPLAGPPVLPAAASAAHLEPH